MSAVVQVTKTGPKTFTPAEQILGGQLVEARGSSRIGVAAAGSLKVLGVALTDAINPEAVVTTPVTTNGRPVLNAAAFPQRVGVCYGGDEVPVTYTNAAAFGDKLIAAALGQVTPAVVLPARTVADGATTSASTTVTSATAAFTSADVGRGISGAGIPAGTTIASVTNGTTVVLSAAATATAAGVTLAIAATTLDVRTIVGTCTEPAGVQAGAVGLMRTV